MSDPCDTLTVRYLGTQAYEPVWRAMREFTDARGADTADEFWLLEHPPVFTQGQAGKAEHLLAPGDIPVVQVDRGGQVTYHGPGQLVGYVLVDLKRLSIGIRDLVTALEDSIIAVLGDMGISAQARRDAPGVYLETGAKLAQLGLRVRRGCTFHGLSLNCDMDLSPFRRINPCGYAGLQVTDIATQLGQKPSQRQLGDQLSEQLQARLGYRQRQIVFDAAPPELSVVNV